MQPLVTIVTPCYNHEKYLDEYFEGLLSQSYENIELIIFDDGSSDGSWEKILSYQQRLREKFPFVILERHENIGPTEELRLALDRALGELLCILESDDYYLPTKIEENVRFLQDHPDMGAVHSDIDYVYAKRIAHRHWKRAGRRIPSGDIFEELLVDNFIMTCSFCCRTDLFREHVNLREYLSKGYLARDYALFLDLARHTQIGYIDKSLVRYRVLQESFSHSTNLEKAFAFVKNIHQIKLDYIEQYGGSDSARRLAIEGAYESLFLFGFRMHRKDECLQAYKWLSQHNPERYRAIPFRALALSMRNESAWRIMRWIESKSIARATALDLFSLRNRGRSETD